MQKYDEDDFLRDAEEMKNKVSQIKLSDDFKAKLQEKMDLEFEKETVNPNLESDNKIKLKLNNLFFIPKFAVALCLFVLVSGCITFADDIESFVSQIFSNTDRELELAIENGNYRELDMDYIESDGVAIKVDYIIEDEDSLYIAFNVKTEEVYENVLLNNYVLMDQNDEVIYDNLNVNKENVDMKLFNNFIDKGNKYLIYKIENLPKNILKNNTLKIKIRDISFSNENKMNNIKFNKCIFIIDNIQG